MPVPSRYRTGWLAVSAAGVLVSLCALAQATCWCDCDGDCTVTVDEIIKGVNIALGTAPLSSCAIADPNADGESTINELIGCVSNALIGCPQESCSTRKCGDGRTESGEECDDGGLCVGGSNAGTPCTFDTDCHGPGVCEEDPYLHHECAADSDCPGGLCVRCRAFGGDGCAANCTRETDVVVDLVPGTVAGIDISTATSGFVVHGDPIILPLPLRGSLTLTLGKAVGLGGVPFVIRAAGVHLPLISLPTVLDACLRGVALQTCGGTPFGADGRLSSSCTPEFAGSVTCPAERPCAFVHGPGNIATGIIGCRQRTCGPHACPYPVDVDLYQDAGGATGTSGPLLVRRSGHGPAGSALGFAAFALSFVQGPGACTDADPPALRGTPFAMPLTTGMASATVTGVNSDSAAALGPFAVQGTPSECTLLVSNSPALSQLGLAGATPLVDLPTFGDVVLTMALVAQ